MRKLRISFFFFVDRISLIVPWDFKGVSQFSRGGFKVETFWILFCGDRKGKLNCLGLG